MDSMWLEVILKYQGRGPGRPLRQTHRQRRPRPGGGGRGGVPGLPGGEPPVLGLCGRGPLLDQMKGVSWVKLYVTDDADGQAQLKTYLAGIDLPYTTILRGVRLGPQLAEVLPPLAIGKRLYIVPEWGAGHRRHPRRGHPAADEPRPHLRHRVPCLHPAVPGGVEAHVQPGDRVLDLGCGSGILAIAALRLGASHATGVDIDPKAVDVAYENAALNDIGRDRCRFLAGNVLADQGLVQTLAQERAQLVLANIVADVIIPWPPWCPS